MDAVDAAVLSLADRGHPDGGGHVAHGICFGSPAAGRGELRHGFDLLRGANVTRDVHAGMMSPTPGGIMALKMAHAMRMELADAIRGRYAAAANKDKSRILEEFIAATGYHEKSAIRVLNTSPEPKRRQTRRRPSLYDEAARGALIVLWEASDRVCSKRLKALLPILLPALERNGHLRLEVEIRCKILSMSAATIDRLLKVPRRTTVTNKAPRAMPEARRRIKMRTFADWKEPPPGNMEMDLVAHCGEAAAAIFTAWF
jgi:hypothetical protein